MTTFTTRRFASGVASIPAIALSPALPAAAANTSTVTIVAQESFGEVGSFRAVGGSLCATGSTDSPGGTTVTERRRTLTFDLEKTFTCADGSGTFTVEIRAWYLPCRPPDRGVWTVVRGRATTRAWVAMVTRRSL